MNDSRSDERGNVLNDVGVEGEVVLNYPFKIGLYSSGIIACYEILIRKVSFLSFNHGEVQKVVVLSGNCPPLPRECLDRLRTFIVSYWSVEVNIQPNFGNICEELRDLKYKHL